MYKIGVILPIYKGDEEGFVKQAVNSILLQSYQEFNIFIGLDGPVTDDVRSYIDSIEEHPQIKIVRSSDNRGLACNANDLIREAIKEECEYYARMDADDISMPDRFEKQIHYLEDHPDIDCVGTWAIEITSDGKEFYRKRMPLNHEECLDFFMKRDCVIHPSVMFRKSYIEKAGMYPTDTYYCEDTMMWTQGFANGCRFANIPEYLYKFRLNEGFFSRRRGWKHAKSILLLRWRVNKLLHFPIKAYLYAILYAFAKMMPTFLLKVLYRVAR